MPLIIPPATPLPWLRLSNASGTTSVSNNTITTMSFDTADSGNGWPKPAVPVTTITFPFSGMLWIALFDLDWQDAAITISTGVRRIGHHNPVIGATSRKMGTTIVGAGGTANNQSVQSFVDVKSVTAGETMEFIVLQTSASTLTPSIGNAFMQYIQLGAVPFSAAAT